MTPKSAEAVATEEAVRAEEGSNLFIELFSPPEDAENPEAHTAFQRELRTFLNGLARENRSAKEDLKILGSILHRLPQITATTAKDTDRPIRIKKLTPGGNEVVEEAAKGISFTTAEGGDLGAVGGGAIKAIQLDIITEKGRKTKKGRRGGRGEVNTPPPMIRVNFYGETRELASLAIRQDPQDNSIRAEFRAGFVKDGAPVKSGKFPPECNEFFPQIQDALAHKLLSPKKTVETVEAPTEKIASEEEAAEGGEQSQWAKDLQACELKLKTLIPDDIPHAQIKTLRKELDMKEGEYDGGRVLLCYLLNITPQQLNQPEELIGHLGAGASLVPKLPNILETTLLRRMEKEGMVSTQSTIVQDVLRDIRAQFQTLKDLEEEDIV